MQGIKNRDNHKRSLSKEKSIFLVELKQYEKAFEMVDSRQRWMDFARALCILIVIFGHATIPTRDIAQLAYADSLEFFYRFAEPFRIPLLMFLSGMLLYKSLKKPTSEYIWGKFNLIFWPFLLWSMVVYAAEERLFLISILKTPISAPSVLWYLWFLCAFYLIGLFLTRYSVPLLAVIVVCLVSSAFLPSFLRLDRFAFLFAFFLMGHCVSTHSLASRVNRPIAFLGLLAALAGGYMSATGNYIRYDPLFVWVPLGLALFVLWSSQFFRSNALTAPLEWVGRNSIVFYAVHYPVEVVTARWLSSNLELPQDVAWIGSLFYFGLFFAALATGIVIQLLRERFTVFEALFDFRKVVELLSFRQLRTGFNPDKKL